MMNIEIAKQAGFCFGVRRAVEKAFSSLDNREIKKPVYSLGYLVHNSHVVSGLAKKGVTIVKDINDITTSGTVIVSAHGVSPQILEQAAAKDLDIIDTTCVQVHKVQRLARQLRDEGYHVVIVGDKNHPEVKGVKEWAGSNSVVVSSPEELELIDYSQKIGIISQTTISVSLFEKITSSIKIKVQDNLKVFNTICNATSTRQRAARQLAQRVDIMLVIGDTKSANTKRLLEISREVLREAYLISEPDDIEAGWFEQKKNVGITAGASTPHQIIDSVVKRIETIRK